VLLYLDFFWFTKDYHSASDMMRRPSSEEKVKYMSDMAFALKSILVLFLFMFAVCILLVPMVMYQSGLMEVKITPIASLVLGHLSIYLTQYAYEIGGTKCS
jgi:sterol desaturase/sphingolipid hydroxylase (fatty acid hydroxylase superfamily)